MMVHELRADVEKYPNGDQYEWTARFVVVFSHQFMVFLLFVYYLVHSQMRTRLNNWL